jgi:hypothetical protein
LLCPHADLWLSSKSLVIEHEPNPLLDLLGQLLALAVMTTFLQPTSETTKISTGPKSRHTRGMQLKIKRGQLDLPIFRQPDRPTNGYRTSPEKPLKAIPWGRYLKRLGFKARLKQNLSQYVFHVASSTRSTV